MKKFRLLQVISLIVPASLSAFAQTEQSAETPLCSQDKTEKLRLIKKAEENRYYIHRLYFVGNIATRHRTFREYMAESFNEGYVFSRENLLQNIKGINKLKSVKPISLDNVEVRLERDEVRNTDVINFDICVQEINVFLTHEERAALIKSIEEAEANEYYVRRIEIAGNLTTRHRVFAEKMAFGEGDIFTRKLLEKSIKNVSRIKQIYPIRLDNIEVRLDKNSKDIDLLFVVVERK